MLTIGHDLTSYDCQFWNDSVYSQIKQICAKTEI